MEGTTAAKQPERESDCSRLLARVKGITNGLERNLGRLKATTTFLYCPTSDNKPTSEKREEGWIGEMEAALDELESFVVVFGDDLEWLAKLTG